MRSVTPDEILDAAYEQLLHFGVRRVSVEDIARQMGVARITIYRKFPSKDELLTAVVLREGQRLLARIEAAIDVDAPLDEQLVDGFAAVLVAVRNHPLVKRTLASEPDIAAGLLSVKSAAPIAFARDYAAARLDIPPAVAEVMIRLSASFVLSPESVIPLKTTEDCRAFARTHLVPMLPTRSRPKVKART